MLLAIAIAIALAAAACTPGGEATAPTTSADDEARTTTSIGTTTTAPTPTTTVPDPVVDDTPLPSDAEVRTGTLDNGVRYLVRTNDSPGGALELRLVVDAGSLHQPRAEDGSAHVLEHMAFNGTASYPGNTLDDALADVGAVIGPHINAYTSFDETVYQLSLPATPAAIDLGFQTLSEWAGAMLLTEADVADELLVVLEELRLSRNAPGTVVNDTFLDAYLGGTPYADHDPIGEEAAVADLDAGTLRRFFDDWYRPDNITVIAVGDVEVDDLEARIVEAFDGLTDRGATPAQPDRTAPLPTDPFIRVVEAPDTTTSFVSVDWMLPAWDGTTVGGERLVMLEQVLFHLLATRLDDASLRGDNELLVVGGGRFAVTRERAGGGFYAEADDLGAAAELVIGTLRGAAEGDVAAEELARTVEEFRASVELELETIESVQDRELADALVGVALGTTDPSAAADRVRRRVAVLDTFTPDDLIAHARWILASSAPQVIAAGPDAADLPDVARLEAALEASGAAGPSEATARIDRIMTAPDPIAPVEEVSLRRDAVEWRFANGVVVRFEPSTIAADTVDLRASSPGGARALGDVPFSLADVAVDAFGASGVDDLDPVVLDAFLAGRNVWLVPLLDDHTEGFVGAASTVDVEVLFQLLRASIDGPRIDEVPFARVVDARAEQIESLALDPATAAVIEAADLVEDRDPAWTPLPTSGGLAAFDIDAARRIVADRFGSIDGGLTVVVVGDADRLEIARLAATYLGTIQPGAADAVLGDRPLPPPPTEVRAAELGVGSDAEASGQVVLRWRTLDPARDAAARAEAMVLGAVLDDLVFEELRERLGATYGGRASISLGERAEAAGASIVVQVDPDRVEEVRDEALVILDSLRASGPTDEVVTRAIGVVRRELDLVNNPELIARLFALDEPGSDLEPSAIVAEVNRLTPARLAEATRRWFPEGRRVEVLVRPGG